ncbi:glycosyltransferase involved in cell wall biosynthesis [Comamonas sp. BIGb0124]|uniref:glycosyltransferase n=1 Tax=Comamonas sp. BIGb0124 TaxID=2485130 RepID=UPI000F47892A|nr:glycosyltransferase [Comamonas sp. BIGb0124]ROR18604.1 glycosyltransferase involved in cell wall biosynthesis [Comamonas sp. BIGb0124]
MKVFVIRDGVFTLNDGVPSSNLLYYAAFPKRYLAVFDSVTMVGRLFSKEDPTAKPVTGPNVDFVSLPGYHGPIGFLKNLPKIISVINRSIDPNAAYILRVPTTVPSLYSVLLYLKRIPFAVEVAADPYDGYSPQALGNHPLSRFFQWFFPLLMRWQCRNAVAAAYVTRDALQRRYPARNAESSFSFTSIDLVPEAYRSEPRTYESTRNASLRLVIIGNMQKTLKGHDVLLHSLAKLRSKNFDLKLTIIGYGENLAFFQKMAEDLGLKDHVEFTGKLQNGEPIRSVLDRCDIFVLPSRQEGLPRALLEAMARGLPAIATRVGGTPELLEEHALVEPDDIDGLAGRIQHFVENPELLNQEAARNLALSHEYSMENVTIQRNRFFERVKQASRRV